MHPTLRLVAYLKPHWLVVVLSTVLSLLIVALEGINVWVGAGFIEQLATGHAPSLTGGGHSILSGWLDAVARVVLKRATPFQTLVVAVLVLVSARLLVSAARITKISLVARANQAVLSGIRRDLFAHVTRLGPSFSRTTRPGEIASVFSQDVEMLNGALFDVVDRSILQPTRLVVALLLMASISLELFLWIVLILVVGGLLIHRVGDRIERLCGVALANMGSLQGHLTEYLSLAMLARLFGRESHERQRFDETAGLVARNMVQIVRMRALAAELVQGAFFAGGGLLLLLAGYRIFVQGTLSAPSLLKLALLLPLCTYSTESLAAMYASLRASTASARRVFALLDLPPLPPDPPDAVDLGPLRRSIELREVGYSVGPRTILEGIDLTLPQGKRVVIQGPTGAGKSTLLSLIAGYLQHTSGAITLDGVDIRSIRLSAWRERIGIVTQEPLLMSGNVRDNLLYVVPDADDERLHAALAKALLGPASHALPLGLDTPVGNRGELLSGGERQRLTIARALLRNPEVLLMDEPTSMLDRASRDLMCETILSASAGRTLVLVSHDESLSAIADVLVRLEAGRIVSRS